MESHWLLNFTNHLEDREYSGAYSGFRPGGGGRDLKFIITSRGVRLSPREARFIIPPPRASFAPPPPP